VRVTKTHFEELSCDFYILWFHTIPNYLKKSVHLRSTSHLPKRKEQLLHR
jgi:hypothetical protein